MNQGKIRVGVSGWTYAPWRGSFYPKGLTQKKELEYASRKLNTIEVNGTFYGLQKPKSFQAWYDQTPADFCFAVKGGQFITHVLRLKEFEEPVSTFLASGLFCLKEKLGPILWQFPPNVTLKDDRFEKFLRYLPYDSEEAEKVARDHSSRIEGNAQTEAGGKYPIRHAFEFRHASFKNADFLATMREFGAAVVVADSAGKAPYIEDVTADFVYARMHGQDERFAKGYTDDAIEAFASRVRAWASGKDPKGAELLLPAPPSKPRDVFVYFSTDEKEYSPFDALKMIKALGLQ